MEFENIDWAALERLRAAFLEGSAGYRDYWHSLTDLASYDQTFAQRIGWKWDYVLEELACRGWTPPGGFVLDWGCGSGIAGRAFLDHFGPKRVSGLLLWDRSSLALEFARSRAASRFPGLPVRTLTNTDTAFETLLVSHVLTELNEAQMKSLLALASRATTILWVEPGTHDASRRLSGIRERFLPEFNVIAPCTHQGPCGALAAGREAHWCHHFATPPPQVFTDGDWARFAALAGIDLRSLPLSFLVLDKRPAPALPTGAVRLIGRPRVYKAHALLLTCDERGLAERRLSKRTHPEQFRRVKKGEIDPVHGWESEGGEIEGGHSEES